jgi:hypothetical protein
MSSHFRKIGAAVAMLVLAVFGVAACAAPSPAGSAAPAEVAVDLAAEEQVLAEVGYEAEIAPAPTPSASPDDRRAGWRKRAAARALLRRNTLHGEAVVQTKDGTKTVVVQRGTVTAITDTTVSIKSTDGFALTWTFADKLRVVEHRKAVQPDAIKPGDEIGVAGRKEGDRTLARLIIKR